MHTIIPLSRFRPLLAAVMVLSLSTLIHAQSTKEGRFTLGANQTVSFTTTADGAAQLELTLPESYLPQPTPTEANIKLVNSNDYVWWTATLKARPDQTWVTVLSPIGVESVLIADKATISFDTGEGTATSPILVIPRERLVEQLGACVPRMNGKPFFFTPSTIEDTPEAPAASVSRDAAEIYVTNVERWDNEMQSCLYEFDTDLVRARSLWRDLRTAGRLPWKPDVVRQLGAIYDHEQDQRSTLKKIRTDIRAQATSFVSAWNAQHASDDDTKPLNVTFYNNS